MEAFKSSAMGVWIEVSVWRFTATGFAPMLEASGGATNNSATNMPVFQVQRIDNDQMRFIANDETVNLSDTRFTGSASAPAGFSPGPVRVRVWVNGVPSASRYALLAACGASDTVSAMALSPSNIVS